MQFLKHSTGLTFRADRIPLLLLWCYTKGIDELHDIARGKRNGRSRQVREISKNN